MHLLRHPKGKYSLGVDLATSGADETAFVILEQKTFGDNTIKVIYTHTMEQSDGVQIRNYMLMLHKQFNFDKIYVDATGMGDTFTDFLVEELGRVVEGLKFTQASKQEIFENLRILMQEKKLIYPKTDRKLIKQLLSIKFEFSKRQDSKEDITKRKRIYHDSREHDDLVVALCLAAIYFSRKESPKTHGFVIGHV